MRDERYEDITVSWQDDDSEVESYSTLYDALWAVYTRTGFNEYTTDSHISSGTKYPGVTVTGTKEVVACILGDVRVVSHGNVAFFMELVAAQEGSARRYDL